MHLITQAVGRCDIRRSSSSHGRWREGPRGPSCSIVSRKSHHIITSYRYLGSRQKGTEYGLHVLIDMSQQIALRFSPPLTYMYMRFVRWLVGLLACCVTLVCLSLGNPIQSYY